METDDSRTPDDDTCDEVEERNANRPVFRFERERPISTSPSETFWSHTIPLTLERRMDKNVYRKGRRCLVRNTPDDGTLHYVHCLSRRLDPRRVNDLEFAWGMKRGTLNLDTRSNVFCLSAKFKSLWEDSKWLLLPEEHIVERYYTAAMNNQEFPDIGEGPYKYQFLAHPNMKSVAVHRQTTLPVKETDGLTPEHFTFYSFPFYDLGIMTSHVHPRFVISHIGARPLKLRARLMGEYGRAHTSVSDSIRKCAHILGKWSHHIDEVASKDMQFMDSWIDLDDVYSETSDRTANCRLHPHMCDERLIQEWDYVYVKEEDGVKLKHKEDAPHLLTAKKLRIFEEQKPRRASHGNWKAILSWRVAISGDPEERECIDDSIEDMDDPKWGKGHMCTWNLMDVSKPTDLIII